MEYVITTNDPREAVKQLIDLVGHVRQQEWTAPTTRNKQREDRVKAIDNILSVLRQVRVEFENVSEIHNDDGSIMRGVWLPIELT